MSRSWGLSGESRLFFLHKYFFSVCRDYRDKWSELPSGSREVPMWVDGKAIKSGNHALSHSLLRDAISPRFDGESLGSVSLRRTKTQQPETNFSRLLAAAQTRCTANLVLLRGNKRFLGNSLSESQKQTCLIASVWFSFPFYECLLFPGYRSCTVSPH